MRHEHNKEATVITDDKLEKLAAEVGDEVTTLLTLILCSQDPNTVKQNYESYIEKHGFFPYQAALYIGDPAPCVTLLHILVAYECSEFIKQVLAHSKLQQPCYTIDVTRVDNLGDTPLHVAIYKENFEISVSLINAGFSILALNNRMQCPLSLVEENMRSHIYAAAEQYSGRDAELLGRRALITAIKIKKLNLVKWLVEECHIACNFNDEDDHHEYLTPAMLALKNYMHDPSTSNEAIVDYLRGRGVNPELKNANNQNFQALMLELTQQSLFEVVKHTARIKLPIVKPSTVDKPNVTLIKFAAKLRAQEEGVENQLKAFFREHNVSQSSVSHSDVLSQALGLLLSVLLELKHSLLLFDVVPLIPQRALIPCVTKYFEIAQMSNITAVDFVRELQTVVEQIVLLPSINLQPLQAIKNIAENKFFSDLLIRKAQSSLKLADGINQLQFIFKLLGNTTGKLQPVMEALYDELIKASDSDYKRLIAAIKIIRTHDSQTVIYSLFGNADLSLVVRKALMLRDLFPTAHEVSEIPQLLLLLVDQYSVIRGNTGQAKSLRAQLFNFIVQLKKSMQSNQDIAAVTQAIIASRNETLSKLFNISLPKNPSRNIEKEKPKKINTVTSSDSQLPARNMAELPPQKLLPLRNNNSKRLPNSSLFKQRAQVGDYHVTLVPAPRHHTGDPSGQQKFELKLGEFPMLPIVPKQLETSTASVESSVKSLPQSRALFLENESMVMIDDQFWQSELPQPQLPQKFSVGMSYAVGSLILSVIKLDTGDLRLAIEGDHHKLSFYSNPPDPCLFMIIKDGDAYYGVPKTASRWSGYQPPFSADAQAFVPLPRQHLWQQATTAGVNVDVPSVGAGLPSQIRPR